MKTSVNQRKPADNKVRSKVRFSFSQGCVKPRIESSAIEMFQFSSILKQATIDNMPLSYVHIREHTYLPHNRVAIFYQF